MKAKERKSGLIVLFNSQYESFCVFHITFATEKNLTYPKSDKNHTIDDIWTVSGFRSVAPSSAYRISHGYSDRVRLV